MNEDEKVKKRRKEKKYGKMSIKEEITNKIISGWLQYILTNKESVREKSTQFSFCENYKGSNDVHLTSRFSRTKCNNVIIIYVARNF